jgi:uncharacterized membrane protein YfcA
MAGALQTAAGVAGGVVLADMLTSMFHHSQPQEIVNIIEQPVEQVSDVAGDQNFLTIFRIRTASPMLPTAASLTRATTTIAVSSIRMMTTISAAITTTTALSD